MKILFAPRPVPLLAALVLSAAAIWIGNIQSGRAEQKQADFDRIQGAMHRPPIQIGAILVEAKMFDQQPVVARGRWLGEKSILLDNKVHNGIAGYHVVTPLRIEGSSIAVLVNRGWVAAPRLRTELPALPALPQTLVEVKGVARIPPMKTFELAPDRAQGMIWQHLTLERFQAWSGLELHPVILLQTDEPGDGLVRDWLPADSGALKHWGFALLWYLAAAAAAVAALIFSVKRRNHET